MWMYLITYSIVTIQNVIYLFNINFPNIDGYCRSWIEYLNERYNVCILDRSIPLDNNSCTFCKYVLQWDNKSIQNNLNISTSIKAHKYI